MSFLSPVWLLLLLAALALVAIYVFRQLRRKAYAARFTNVDLLGRIVPKRPGWRRHLAFALLLTSLAALTVAMAKPAAEVRVPRDRATVVMALDVSLSMKAEDVKPNRFEAMKDAAKDFVQRLPPRINLGLVSFAGTANVVQAPTTDRAAVTTAIDNLKLEEATATGEAIFASLSAIQNFESSTQAEDGEAAPARVVLLSDGYRTVGRPLDQAISAAKEAKIPISTIAFGTEGATVDVGGDVIPVPVDVDSLEQIAKDTGGSFFAAESADQIDDVYSDLGSQIGYRNEYREITVWFVGAGLILAFGAVGVSLIWTNRLL